VVSLLLSLVYLFEEDDPLVPLAAAVVVTVSTDGTSSTDEVGNGVPSPVEVSAVTFSLWVLMMVSLLLLPLVNTPPSPTVMGAV